MQISYLDCQAQWGGAELAVGNACLERRWRIENGLLVSSSFRDLTTGRELLLVPSDRPAPCPEFAVEAPCRSVSIAAAQEQALVVELPALVVRARADYGDYALTTAIKFYPQTAAITTWLEIEGTPPAVAAPGPAKDVATGVEPVHFSGREQPSYLDLNDYMRLEHVHHVLGVVALMDVTDRNDNLCHTRRDLLTIAQRVAYRGNLFFWESQRTGEGLAFLKEAPLPHARPIRSAADLLIDRDVWTFAGLGAGEASPRASYPFTALPYRDGDAGRAEALQAYQRAVRRPDPERDNIIWHNNWGDRNRDTRMGESFLLAELDSLAEMGMDQLHPDDGWQKGITSNSATPGGRWEGHWEEPDFWTPHPQRFPRGFAPVTEAARAKGFKLGLWYDVDLSNDYANWERDAATLLGLYREHGFRYFKLDGIIFNTKRGEANLRRCMERVIQESGGQATVLLDITAGQRQGYFGAMPYGVLFVENRYTDWHKYWPHCSLRNLWQLAHYVDPGRLVVEFLNNTRHQDKYSGDPLAPGQYAPDYLLASVMFARPLAWFEASALPQAYRDALKPLVAVYKQHRDRLFAGTILPIGEEPSGFSWTGFQSQRRGAVDGYLLALRELNDRPAATLRLVWLAPGRYRFEHLCGSGESFAADLDAGGAVQIALPGPLNYGFYRYQRI